MTIEVRWLTLKYVSITHDHTLFWTPSVFSYADKLGEALPYIYDILYKYIEWTELLKIYMGLDQNVVTHYP